MNIVDDYTREALAIEVDFSLPGARVVRVLDQLATTRGLPAAITIDNGPEFAGKGLDRWVEPLITVISPKAQGDRPFVYNGFGFPA